MMVFLYGIDDSSLKALEKVRFDSICLAQPISFVPQVNKKILKGILHQVMIHCQLAAKVKKDICILLVNGDKSLFIACPKSVPKAAFLHSHTEPVSCWSRGSGCFGFYGTFMEQGHGDGIMRSSP